MKRLICIPGGGTLEFENKKHLKVHVGKLFKLFKTTMIKSLSKDKILPHTKLWNQAMIEAQKSACEFLAKNNPESFKYTK